MGETARVAPPAASGDLVCIRVGGKQATIRDSDGRKGSRQLKRGSLHAPAPRMIGKQCSMSISTEMQTVVRVPSPLRSAKAFRIADVNEVTHTFTGKHLAHRQKHFRVNFQMYARSACATLKLL
jgi:hypothetical protein